MRGILVHILRQRRRVSPILVFFVIGVIFIIFTILVSPPSQRTSPGKSIQRKTRTVRQVNESKASSETEATTMRDELSFMETTTMKMEEATDPIPLPPAPNPPMTLPQKISIRDKLRAFELPANYSKTVVPSSQAAAISRITSDEELEKYSGAIQPVKVLVGVKVEGIQVDELDEEVIMPLQLFLKWDDALIKAHYTQDVSYLDVDNVNNYRTLDPSFAAKIWKPDIFIENLIKVTQPELITPLITLNINPYTGTVIYITRITAKVACSMDFQYYPVDTQQCEIVLRSNSQGEADISLHWEDVVLLDLSEPNFYIQISEFDSYRHIEQFIGFFFKPISALKFTILAKRKISYHMVQSFLPSLFFVFITWLCFLIPAKSAEVRIGIAMTTLLTLTAMFAAIRESTPIVSYVKAIDVWMVFCIFFVFGTLFEFAILIYLQSCSEHYTEKEDKYKDKVQRKMVKHSNSMMENNDQPERVVDVKPSLGSALSLKIKKIEEKSAQVSKKAKYYTYMAKFVEKHAFGAFAVGFLIFNISYWWWLLSCAEYFEWSIEEHLNEIGDD